MSILIKGMEMPKRCEDCRAICSHTEGWRCGLVSPTTRPMTFTELYKNCPLVEIPKHGRLIDADDVLTQTRHGECETSFELGKEYGWNLAIEYVGNFAPTIIEAEE